MAQNVELVPMGKKGESKNLLQGPFFFVLKCCCTLMILFGFLGTACRSLLDHLFSSQEREVAWEDQQEQQGEIEGEEKQWTNRWEKREATERWTQHGQWTEDSWETPVNQHWENAWAEWPEEEEPAWAGKEKPEEYREENYAEDMENVETGSFERLVEENDIPPERWDPGIYFFWMYHAWQVCFTVYV